MPKTIAPKRCLNLKKAHGSNDYWQTGVLVNLHFLILLNYQLLGLQMQRSSDCQGFKFTDREYRESENTVSNSPLRTIAPHDFFPAPHDFFSTPHVFFSEK